MAACTFFGHSDCYRLDEDMLQRTIEDLIAQGVDTFYVGNHGNFDSAVFSCLMRLKDTYPRISFAVVLAYLPIQKSEYDHYHGYSMYPEIEEGPQRFAIERRNKWMIQASDWCMYIFVSGAEAHRMTSKVAADRTRKERKLVTVGSVEIMAGYTCVYVKAHFSHISNAYGTGERSKASQ